MNDEEIEEMKEDYDKLTPDDFDEKYDIKLSLKEEKEIVRKDIIDKLALDLYKNARRD